MDTKHFSAMTPFEMTEYIPENLAYMACHFSQSGSGLSNLPTHLPPESLLLVDDSIPILEHDPQIAASQLQNIVETFSVSAVLLDFQNPPDDKSKEMAASILQSLPCSCAITQPYVSFFNCPVFLSPPPVTAALSDYLIPWLNRGVYLELAMETSRLTVTANGCTASIIDAPSEPMQHYDNRLFCHYRVDVETDKAHFTIQRTKEDLLQLSQSAIEMGALGTIGLYQEMGR